MQFFPSPEYPYLHTQLGIGLPGIHSAVLGQIDPVSQVSAEISIKMVVDRQ